MSPWLLVAIVIGWDPWVLTQEKLVSWSWSRSSIQVYKPNETGGAVAVFVDTIWPDLNSRCVIVFTPKGQKPDKDGRLWGWLIDRKNDQVMKIHTRPTDDQIPAWCYKKPRDRRRT